MDVKTKTRERIRKLANLYGLKYNPKLYDYSLLSKKERIILNYLSGCPVPPYSGYGKTFRERIKNFNKFINSKDFYSLAKQSGGCVFKKDYFNKNIKKIKDSKMRKTCIIIKNKIKSPIIITIPENKKEKEIIYNRILLHEWIHVLLQNNKILFQRYGHKLWSLDEGLTCYLENSEIEGKQNIEKLMRRNLKKCSPGFKIYAKNALKFNKLLKNLKTPEKRKKAIYQYLKRTGKK